MLIRVMRENGGLFFCVNEDSTFWTRSLDSAPERKLILQQVADLEVSPREFEAQSKLVRRFKGRVLDDVSAEVCETLLGN